MKALGKYLRYAFNEQGKIELTLLLNNKSSIRAISKLDKGIEYDISIAEFKSKRTLRQSRYMWALIGEIALEMNYDNDTLGVYTQLIRQYGLPFEHIGLIPSAVDKMLKTDKNNSGIFRIMDLVDERDGYNMYKCYYGTSSYSKEEMIVLIDGVLALAVKCGIDTEYWQSVLC
jgi:hypothetical protein